VHEQLLVRVQHDAVVVGESVALQLRRLHPHPQRLKHLRQVELAEVQSNRVVLYHVEHVF
jgi:hypothetical protein